jgi:ribonuclease HII
MVPDPGPGIGLIAGIDEVGRGPLAGPVVAAAVILHPQRLIEGLADSKKLSENRREVLALEIRERAFCWALGRAEPAEIDCLNILQASLLAMQRAVAALAMAPTLALVDGNRAPRLPCPVRTIVGGDASEAAISAASIIAKVARDREMIEMDGRYPGYGLAKHKGYPTKQHMEALKRLGVTDIHRRSFGPVRRLL